MLNIQLDILRWIDALLEESALFNDCVTCIIDGWTREVFKKEIGLIREYTGLTAKDDFDPQVVYKGGPPLSSLINAYRSILLRLAKK